MLCSLEELRKKDVIDIRTGEKLGYIDDIQLDTDHRTIHGYLIYGRRILGLFKREEDLVIPWECLKVYGKDVVLVELP